MILCLLLLVPGAVIFLWRRDLRKMMVIVSGCAVPFAFTEFLFYPTYWEPQFLFDLPQKIGFGIEDFLFVIGLGAFTSAVYPALFLKKLSPVRLHFQSNIFKLLVSVLGAFLLTSLFLFTEIPMIWACVPIMFAIAAAMVFLRRDLVVPALWGGLLSSLFYFAICLLLGVIVPNVFSLNWNAEKFSNIFVLGIPLEEVLYAWAAGTVSTVFYPFVFSRAFVPLKPQQE